MQSNPSGRRTMRVSIRVKLLTPFVVIILFVLVVLLPITNVMIAQRLEVETDRRLSQTAVAFGELLQQTEQTAQLAVSFVANLPEVESIGADRGVAAGVLPALKEELELQELSYYPPDAQARVLFYGGPVITRRGQTSQVTEQIRSSLIADAISTQRPVSGIAIAPQSSQILGVAPVFDENGISGLVLAAFFIDESYISEIGQILNVDAAIIKDNAPIASTIDISSGYELMLQDQFIDPNGGITAQNIKYDDGIDRRLLAHPLVIDGQNQGHILLVRSIQDAFDVQQRIQNIIFVFVGIVCLIMLVFSVGIILNFANPLKRLAEATAIVSAGQFHERVEIQNIFMEDEVVDLNRNFNAMTERLDELYSGLEGKVRERTQELSEALRELAVKRDEALQASKTKSLFLANMSHELRTPLNAIIGYSEMLEEESEDFGYDDIIPDLQKIQKAGKHLLSLINDILDLSKIEAGKVDIYLEEFEIGDLIDEIMVTIQPLIEKNNNKLVLEAADGDLAKVYNDMTKMRQIVFNLLSNAAKFTEEGTIRIQVKRDKADNIDWLQIAVTDSGIGMTPEQLEHVFSEFTQADASTTRKYGGTGLGLPISRHFCHMLGGDITVSSIMDEGSTFTVRIPAFVTLKEPDAVIDAAQPLTEAIAQSQAETSSRAGAVTVLVIDDDATVHDLLNRILNREGFNVVSAFTGEDGLQKARELQPDVITLDVMMPTTDGWAVLSKMKSEPELQNIPVVMLTMLDNKSLGFALGAADYLTKPVDRTSLVAILKRHAPRAGGEGWVLIVEDDDDTRDLFARTAEREGWHPLLAENGLVGLKKLAQNRPDIILLDLMMPEMDGFQFLNEMRKNDDWRSIPVIVVTAKTLTEDERKQLNDGVDRVLHKGSFTADFLVDEIRNILSTHLHEA